jgi:tRNA pseudouridine13 synthase
MLMSSLQSALFNDWLAARINDGLYESTVPGDLMRKEESGGLFINEDDADCQRRMQAWEISPTGPMFGAKMRPAQGAAAEREQTILAGSGIDADALARHAKAGEGTRRSARIRPLHCEVAHEADIIRLSFELPSGAYATAVLREIMKTS